MSFLKNRALYELTGVLSVLVVCGILGRWAVRYTERRRLEAQAADTACRKARGVLLHDAQGRMVCLSVCEAPSWALQRP